METNSQSLNCRAHAADLLIQDCASVFEGQFEQVKYLTEIFRSRHRACALYNELRVASMATW